MKSFLLIGMGKFGRQLCKSLAAQGNEIMIADTSENKMSDLLGMVTSAKIGDCTKADTLSSFGVEEFDACIVCIFDDFQSSLEVTDLLKTLGAKRILSLAGTDVHAKFLERCGADEIIFPERDVAENIAVSISNDSIFEHFELSDGYAVYEIKPMARWHGKSIMQLDVRRRFNISIVAVKRENGQMYMPTADYTFNDSEHLVIIGKDEDVRAVVKD